MQSKLRRAPPSVRGEPLRLLLEANEHAFVLDEVERTQLPYQTDYVDIHQLVFEDIEKRRLFSVLQVGLSSVLAPCPGELGRLCSVVLPCCRRSAGRPTPSEPRDGLATTLPAAPCCAPLCCRPRARCLPFVVLFVRFAHALPLYPLLFFP